MSPISLEARFTNPEKNFSVLAVNNQTLRRNIGDRRIELKGFERGGEAVISRKNVNDKPDKNPDTITVKKTQSKDKSFKFIAKGGKEDTVTLHFLGK